MALPHITSFCCCMSLETGSKVVGFVQLLIAVVLMVVVAIFAEDARGFVGTLDDLDHVYSTVYIVAVVVAIFTVVHVLLALTLLVSAFKRDVTGLRVWVYVMCSLILCSLTYAAGGSLYFGLSNSGSDIFLAFAQGLVFFGAASYCVLCVYSYQLALRCSADAGGPSKSHY